jgi:uridine kinase
MPFLEQFAAHPLQDPYATFWQAGDARAFPYPAFMLYVLVLPRLLLQPFGAEHWPIFLKLFIYRLPLLFADVTILFILTRWSQGRIRKILWLYWASPVLLYISYMHGQLDVIPLALLFVALFELFNERICRSAIALGLGLAAKTHLFVAIPFFLLYIWRHQDRLRPMVVFLLLTIVAFLLPNLPYLAHTGFIDMVFHNAEQQKLTSVALSFSGSASEFYIIPAVFLLLLFKALQISVQNRDLFLMFLGFSFGILLFFITPMPGWYYWVLPFFAYFYARGPKEQMVFPIILQIAYLLYFAVKPDSDFSTLMQAVSPNIAKGTIYQVIADHGYDAAFVNNIAFTLLQTLLAINCAWIYWRGIKGVQKNKLTSGLFILGISGDSGSGKTTLTESLQSLFTPRCMAVVCGDDMHKWQRGHDKWKELTHLDPRANALHEELGYLAALKQRRTIYRRHYDHDTGTFTDDLPIVPRPIVAFEGLHSFYLKPAREMMDLKIFIKPDEDLLLHRKLVRDITIRGYSREKVLENIQRRLDDAEKYIKAQERNADLVISYKLKAAIAEAGDFSSEPPVWLQVTLSNNFFLDPLMEDIANLLPGSIRHYYDAEDRQKIEFDQPLSASMIAFLGEKHIAGLQDLGIYAPLWQADWGGLLQLLVAYCIFQESGKDYAGA